MDLLPGMLQTRWGLALVISGKECRALLVPVDLESRLLQRQLANRFVSGVLKGTIANWGKSCLGNKLKFFY